MNASARGYEIFEHTADVGIRAWGQEFSEVFEEADRNLPTALGGRLSSFVFPPPRFTVEETAVDETALTQTQVAQPAIGAADLAMFRVLESLGIHPDMVAGHSYGEYAALCASGVWSVAELMVVSGKLPRV